MHNTLSLGSVGHLEHNANWVFRNGATQMAFLLTWSACVCLNINVNIYTCTQVRYMYILTLAQCIMLYSSYPFSLYHGALQSQWINNKPPILQIVHHMTRARCWQSCLLIYFILFPLSSSKLSCPSSSWLGSKKPLILPIWFTVIENNYFPLAGTGLGT